MTTSKKGGAAGPNTAIAKANTNALKGFPKAKLRSAFEAMAGYAGEQDNANEARQAAALNVVALAEQFSANNNDADRDTVVNGWRDEMRVLTMTLAVAGNRFATLTEGKDDKPATAKLTGYGNNVASIAKGAIEFDCGPAALAGSGDIEGEPSYRDCRKAVEGARAEARRAADPDAAKFSDTVADADEAWSELRKLVVDTGDLANVQSLLSTLQGHISDVTAQLVAESDDAEQEAEAA